jgi:hypothetical protein
MDAIRVKEIRILRNKYEHSEEIFGVRHNLPSIDAVVTDIVEIACSMMLDESLMGENNQNFHTKYVENEIMYETRIGTKRYRVNDTVYGDFYHSEWFKMAEDKVRREWGSEVNVVGCLLHLDETQMSTNRGMNSTPCYLSILNFDSDTLRKKDGIMLCGYCPVSKVSKATLQSKLEKRGVRSRDKQSSCIKMHYRWLQQQFFRDMLTPIMQMNETGPVRCLKGFGENIREDLTMFVFVGLTGTYMYTCLN